MIQNPKILMLVTSLAEVSIPCGLKLIFVFFHHFFDSFQFPCRQPIMRRQGDQWLKPEFGDSIGCCDMDVATLFFPAVEEKPVTSNLHDRRRHHPLAFSYFKAVRGQLTGLIRALPEIILLLMRLH